MGAIVLDSSLVIAIFDAKDPHHSTIIGRLQTGFQAGREYSLPAVVVSEVLVAAARRNDQAADLRWTDLYQLFGPVRAIDGEIALAAAKLRARHRSLRLPDALVIATGLVDKAETVLTADKRWASIDKRVEVLKPGP